MMVLERLLGFGHLNGSIIFILSIGIYINLILLHVIDKINNLIKLYNLHNIM